jgi:hypothetical protein
MTREKIQKAQITDYPKTVFVDVECPYCSAQQEIELPLDDEVIKECEVDDCGEEFSVDIQDL